jgi:hypothetical protein
VWVIKIQSATSSGSRRLTFRTVAAAMSHGGKSTGLLGYRATLAADDAQTYPGWARILSGALDAKSRLGC